MVKLKADRPCRISKNIDGKTFVWVFEKDDVLDVQDDYINVLLNTGIIKKVKEEKKNEEEVEDNG